MCHPPLKFVNRYIFYANKDFNPAISQNCTIASRLVFSTRNFKTLVTVAALQNYLAISGLQVTTKRQR